MEANYDSDSDQSLENINDFEGGEARPSEGEELRIDNVREAIKEWKIRELDKASDIKQDPEGFARIQQFLQLAARLLYDLLDYIKSSKNKQENLKDKLYVNIVSAIGDPNELTSHERINIEDILNRDLVELPYTVEPRMINIHAKHGIHAATSFS
jgi:hypothetical protein